MWKLTLRYIFRSNTGCQHCETIVFVASEWKRKQTFGQAVCCLWFKRHLAKYKWDAGADSDMWPHLHITVCHPVKATPEFPQPLITLSLSLQWAEPFWGRRGWRNVSENRRKKRKKRKWYPAGFVLEIHWCRLQFEGKLHVTVGEVEVRLSLVRPLVVVELWGVVLAVAALHGDTPRQDGGDIVPEVVPLLLLPLGLDLPQVEPWKVGLQWVDTSQIPFSGLWFKMQQCIVRQLKVQCGIVGDFEEEKVVCALDWTAHYCPTHSN